MTGGNPGGSAPLAMMCSGPILSDVLSKYLRFPLPTSTAPTLRRIGARIQKIEIHEFEKRVASGLVS